MNREKIGESKADVKGSRKTPALLFLVGLLFVVGGIVLLLINPFTWAAGLTLGLEIILCAGGVLFIGGGFFCWFGLHSDSKDNGKQTLKKLTSTKSTSTDEKLTKDHVFTALTKYCIFQGRFQETNHSQQYYNDEKIKLAELKEKIEMGIEGEMVRFSGVVFGNALEGLLDDALDYFNGVTDVVHICQINMDGFEIKKSTLCEILTRIKATYLLTRIIRYECCFDSKSSSKVVIPYDVSHDISFLNISDKLVRGYIRTKLNIIVPEDIKKLIIGFYKSTKSERMSLDLAAYSYSYRLAGLYLPGSDILFLEPPEDKEGAIETIPITLASKSDSPLRIKQVFSIYDCKGGCLILGEDDILYVSSFKEGAGERCEPISYSGINSKDGCKVSKLFFFSSLSANEKFGLALSHENKLLHIGSSVDRGSDTLVLSSQCTKALASYSFIDIAMIDAYLTLENEQNLSRHFAFAIIKEEAIERTKVLELKLEKKDSAYTWKQNRIIKQPSNLVFCAIWAAQNTVLALAKEKATYCFCVLGSFFSTKQNIPVHTRQFKKIEHTSYLESIRGFSFNRYTKLIVGNQSKNRFFLSHEEKIVFFPLRFEVKEVKEEHPEPLNKSQKHYKEINRQGDAVLAAQLAELENNVNDEMYAFKPVTRPEADSFIARYRDEKYDYYNLIDEDYEDLLGDMEKKPLPLIAI